MSQLFAMTQQESAQFMLDISRRMSKAYADLVSNFLSTSCSPKPRHFQGSQSMCRPSLRW